MVTASPGGATVEWDTTGLASGVYFVRAAAYRHALTIKVVLVK
jgi:hypothetical protein